MNCWEKRVFCGIWELAHNLEVTGSNPVPATRSFSRMATTSRKVAFSRTSVTVRVFSCASVRGSAGGCIPRLSPHSPLLSRLHHRQDIRFDRFRLRLPSVDDLGRQTPLVTYAWIGKAIRMVRRVHAHSRRLAGFLYCKRTRLLWTTDVS